MSSQLALKKLSCSFPQSPGRAQGVSLAFSHFPVPSPGAAQPGRGPSFLSLPPISFPLSSLFPAKGPIGGLHVVTLYSEVRLDSAVTGQWSFVSGGGDPADHTHLHTSDDGIREDRKM